MAIYSKKSLAQLHAKIDLVALVSSYLPLKSAGSVYKALCPFHEEKSPSFVIGKGADHYHCFGCGAHGDAISFLMGYMQMGFCEAVESLAARFQVVMEREEGEEQEKGGRKEELKELLLLANQLYHTCLLYTPEGHHALSYLYQRGIDRSFLSLFEVGWAPPAPVFFSFMAAHQVPRSLLHEAGLIRESAEGRPLFVRRITFPILDASGRVVGFSARTLAEKRGVPKYINSPETALFKKGRILYGLSFCRRRIAKEKRALLVEGQVDALRLIQEGITVTLAGQGTAVTEEQVQELVRLGITRIFLAFDGDPAGRLATVKVGDLFQKVGVEVSVISLPAGRDPDRFLLEEGAPAFVAQMEHASDYLTFLVEETGQKVDLSSPAAKSLWVSSLAAQIRRWENPLLIHESLRRLAHLTHLPEELLQRGGEGHAPPPVLHKVGRIGEIFVDPHRILETDLLRWLLLLGEGEPSLIGFIREYLRPHHFVIPACRRLFSLYMEKEEKGEQPDLLLLANQLDTPAEQALLAELLHKRVNRERAAEGVVETVEKLLEREWMEEREKVRLKMETARSSDLLLALAREFDQLKAAPPLLKKRIESKINGDIRE